MRSLLPTLAVLLACDGPSVTETPIAAECSGGLDAVTSREDPSLGEAAPTSPVVSIEVEGVRSVPERLVREAIELEPRAPLSAAAVRADIRRILLNELGPTDRTEPERTIKCLAP